MTEVETTSLPSSAEQDRRTVAQLDKQYQQAVKLNDAETMNQILADDFILVTGTGKVFNKSDLLQEAYDAKTVYEQQDEIEQTVRLWEDTAVVTALLWMKGTASGKPFDRKVWFSDTYVRTAQGWKYVFGQSSTDLPQIDVSNSDSEAVVDLLAPA